MIRQKFGRGAFLALLLNPALLLVDHGHFQYNGVSLGLFLIALCLGNRIITKVSKVTAVNLVVKHVLSGIR